MTLSRYTIKRLNSNIVALPEDRLFELPEKVLQFGTGVLLRGLPDYFIDKANRQGLFNGRVVVVKSTSRGDASVFDKQDGLYTTCVRGIQDGNIIKENVINSCISRVLTAGKDWESILECAHNPSMQIIISNTTETGIELINESTSHHPPTSFPGKLLSFLYERYRAFDGSRQSGMVIIATELIPNNGKKLESIVFELAHLNDLDPGFIEWLEECNHFCNSLVDRIVPGIPTLFPKSLIEEELGYKDDLLIVTEAYALWAIEGNEHVKGVLGFARADERITIEPDIKELYELKLRLLNGTHSLTCGLAFLSRCSSVREALQTEYLSGFINKLIQNEIAPSLQGSICSKKMEMFYAKVMERFSNPFIDHDWQNIATEYSSKIKQRIVPLLVLHYKQKDIAPELISLGFAGFLLYMRAKRKESGFFLGEHYGREYLITDRNASYFYEKWQTVSLKKMVKNILADIAFWEADLSLFPGFTEAVCDKLEVLLAIGVKETLEEVQLTRVA